MDKIDYNECYNRNHPGNIQGFGPSLSHRLAGLPLTEDGLFAHIDM